MTQKSRYYKTISKDPALLTEEERKQRAAGIIYGMSQATVFTNEVIKEKAEKLREEIKQLEKYTCSNADEGCSECPSPPCYE